MSQFLHEEIVNCFLLRNIVSQLNDDEVSYINFRKATTAQCLLFLFNFLDFQKCNSHI